MDDILWDKTPNDTFEVKHLKISYFRIKCNYFLNFSEKRDPHLVRQVLHGALQGAHHGHEAAVDPVAAQEGRSAQSRTTRAPRTHPGYPRAGVVQHDRPQR